MRATLVSIAIVACAGTTNAGTLYPNMAVSGALGNDLQATVPSPAWGGFAGGIGTLEATFTPTDPTWSTSLFVFETDYYYFYDPTGPSEVPPEWAITDYTPKPTHQVITPFVPDGLPAGYNVLYVSSDLKWFSDGHSLYHVPEPSALVSAAIGVLLLSVATLRRRHAP